MVESYDLVNKNSIAGILIFTVLFQVLPAAASSWNPALLVNTETFQTIDDADTDSDLYVRFGDSLNKRLTFERTLDRFNFNDDVYVSGDVNVKGTASGKTIFATESLRSSGSLVWEGAASGASLWVSKFKGAGLVSTCDPTTGKLTWDSTAQQFVCGSDTGGSTSPAQGLSSPASGFLSLSASFTGTSLEIIGTASGRNIHAQDRLTTSGSLIVSGATPVLTGTYDTSGTARFLDVAGRYTYIGDNTAGLRIVDVSNPASPALIGTYDTTGDAFGVAVTGRYAYVADQASGLQIIDVSNPSAPVLKGTYNTSGNAYDVAIAGRYAYVADEGSGLQIIDVANPASPVLVGTYDTSDAAYGIAVAGRYAYVADYNTGLLVIDISNPASPVLIGTYNTSGLAVAVAIAGRYAYVADYSSLQIIDITTPSSPTSIGSISGIGDVRGIAFAGRYAYTASEGSGLQMIDVSTPTSPKLVGTYDTSGTAREVSISGQYAYVADSSSGLQVIRTQSIDAPGATLGSIEAGHLSVRSNAQINGNLSVDRGMNIGDGLYVYGQTAMRAFSGAALTLSTQDRSTKPALSIVGMGSGRVLHAQDRLSSSGTFIAEGNAATKGNLSLNSDNSAADAVLTFGNNTLAETLTFSVSNSRFEFSDDTYVQNTLTVDGNTTVNAGLTIGDNSADTVTVNSAGWTFANDTTVALTGGTNGINFDSNTLSIDGANDRIGIKTAAPDTELEVVGTASGKKIFATDSLASSGNLAIGSLWKRGSGAIAAIPTEYQTGAYLFASGASALALESYTQNLYGTQPLAPSILFGYKGVFDTNLYRTSGSTLRTDDQFLITTTDALNRHAFRIDSEESTSTQDLVEIYSDVSTNENRVFRFRADGNAYADGSWNGGGADLAEWFPTADPGMTPGDLVCLDPKRPLHVKRCNSTKLRIIGIVSTKPGFVGGQEEKLLLEGKTPVLVGLLGQIPTKVTGNVEIGDIIGLSPIDAVGSRLIAPGQSVCTALETHEGPGIGIITCLAPTLQFWTGSIGTE